MGMDPISIGVGVAGAGLLGSALKKKARSPAADMQSQLAQMLFSQTDPLRQSLIGRSEDFLGVQQQPAMQDVLSWLQGGALPQSNPTVGMGIPASPTYEALKLSADQNFGQAKDNAIARLAPGGGLTDALVDLEGQRAGALTQGAGQIYENELSRAMALATGMTGTSLSALGQAGNVQAGLAAANAQQSAGKSQGLGQGLGYLIGSK